MTPMLSATRSTQTHARHFAAPLAIAAVLTAGCGGGEPADTGDTPAPTSTASQSESSATQLGVTETEFTIELSETSVAPGEYAFAIANDGSLPHNLAISGPGVDQEISDTFQGGLSGELSVTLQEGTYTLWCAVGNHRAQGMETALEVTG